MKKKLDIYTDLVAKDFIEQLLPNYILKFSSLNNISEHTNKDNGGIIISDKIETQDITNRLLSRYILISSNSLNKNFINKNICILKPPIKPSELKYKIDKFLFSATIEFEDILIDNKKLSNTINSKYCYLTDIEIEIITYLINYQNPSKEYIKNNILNLRSVVETNSLDSHLTRIRKKFEKINTKLLIKSKNDDISISC